MEQHPAEVKNQDHNHSHNHNQNQNQTVSIPGLSDEESKKAAELIQRTYRGHRARRQLEGFGLDAETRWYEAVRDAQYKNLTTPRAPTSESPNESTDQDYSAPRSKWKHATQIARRAGADDHSVSGSSSNEEDMTEKQRKEKRAQAIAERKKTAKMMDLQYFLEMVDQRHRYGSNLRKYHAYWKSQDTAQPFFYWLDEGEGKDVEVPECSRARLNKMQVRYLSREERLNYLVKVDREGMLVWAKNGERVWTKDELYRDSVKGIVSTSDSTPAFKYNVKTDDNSSSEDELSDDDDAGNEGEQYVNEEFHRATGPAKLKHVSAAVFFNHMVRTSLKKGRKWIFVADTSFRLYIGYKQSGAFQHSSFLHGARILAAGQIKVKHGQLRNLEPLSGHYRPPVANFRAFVHALQDEGVDMSRVSISKSYAVLLGLEGYERTTSRAKKAESNVKHEMNKVFRPEKAQAEEEKQQDNSESARKERLYLEQERQRQEDERKKLALPQRTGNRLSRVIRHLTGRKDEVPFAPNRGIPGSGPEDGVPPPEGRR